MQIRGNNIIAFILAIVGLVVLLKFLPAITAFLATINRIGPGHSTDEKTIGLIALGLVCVIIVAIVKILTVRNSK